jgi:hypothetical protein
MTFSWGARDQPNRPDPRLVTFFVFLFLFVRVVQESDFLSVAKLFFWPFIPGIGGFEYIST